MSFEVQSNTAISLLMIFKTSAGLELDIVLIFFKFNFPALWLCLTWVELYSRQNGKDQETLLQEVEVQKIPLFGQYFCRNLDTMSDLVGLSILFILKLLK